MAFWARKTGSTDGWQRAARLGVAIGLVLAGIGVASAQSVLLPRPDPREAAATAAPEPALPASGATAAAPAAGDASATDPAAVDSAAATDPSATTSPTARTLLEQQLNQRSPQPAITQDDGTAARGDRRELLDFVVVARLTPASEPLTSGVVWRVFGTIPAADGKLPLIGEAEGGALNLSLDEGEYLVHAAYGRAGATKRIGVSRAQLADEIVLHAGGIRLTAFLGEEELDAEHASFEVYEEDDEFGERSLIIPSAKAGQIIRLNAGLYHVVSRYGSSNAVVRADITVEAGKLTEAKVFHKAAQVTLKLVANHGGEALADTSWSVTTVDGEVVVESVGAFPSIILTEGDYVAIARHDGETYQRDFSVETDLNRDIEVLANRPDDDPDEFDSTIDPASLTLPQPR